MAKKTNVRKPKNKDRVEIEKLLSTGITPNDLFSARLKQGKKHPCVRTIQEWNKEVKKVINSEDYQRLEQPWDISRTIKEIPSDILMTVLEILFNRLRENPPNHITVREALWISRFAHVIKDNQLLWQHACRYAEIDRVGQITGKDLLAFLNIGYDARLYQDAGGKDSLASDFATSMLLQAREAAKNREKTQKGGVQNEGQS
jgi:hypothetical protein